MTAAQCLSDEQFAQYFLTSNTVGPGEDVLDVEPKVAAWLSRHRMDHRSPFKIALAVAKLVKAQAAPVSELDPQWQQANREGYGDQPDIAAMTMRQFAGHRLDLGMDRNTDLIAFLGGSR